MMKQNELNMYYILAHKRIQEIEFTLDKYIKKIYDLAYEKGMEFVCNGTFQLLINSLNSLNTFMKDIKEQLSLTYRLEDKDYLDLVDRLKKELSVDSEGEIIKKQEMYREEKLKLHQIYSHLGVEAYGEDIHEQALKEIDSLQKELVNKEKLICNLNNEAQKYFEDAYCNNFHH